LTLRRHFGDKEGIIELNPLGALRHSPFVRGRKYLGNSPARPRPPFARASSATASEMRFSSRKQMAKAIKRPHYLSHQIP
jgi:hypothetical protein